VARRVLANDRRGRARRDRLRFDLAGLVAADHAVAVTGDLALHAALARLDDLDLDALRDVAEDMHVASPAEWEGLLEVSATSG
jgi:hypothetical protein